MDPLGLFGVMLRAAALSLGGLGSLPLLRADLVATGVVSEGELVQALAVGRVSPGPTGLWAVSLGYFAGGFAGALAATLAITLPPLALLPAVAIARRWLLSRPFAGLVRGVALATAGLLVATGIGIVGAAGIPAWWQGGLAAAAIVLTYRPSFHPAVLILAGAVVGLALGR